MMEETILTITGSDSTGCSGVQADVRIISELGGFATSVITSVTTQNTIGIDQIYDLPSGVVESQIDAIVCDVVPSVVKIGMVRRRDALKAVIDMLRRISPRYVVFNPNIRSARGELLMSSSTLELVRTELLPLCSLVVMRRCDEGEILGNCVFGGKICYLDDGSAHGVSNSFVSAICVGLSQGKSVEDSISVAIDYVRHQGTARLGLRGRGNELYSEFISLVKSQGGERRDVTFYADRLRVGARYLSQVTKRIGGKSPKSIIDEAMTDKIKRRLRSSSESIQAISYDCGFPSQAQLTKFFKKMTSLTPTDFRRKHDDSIQQIRNIQTKKHEEN